MTMDFASRAILNCDLPSWAYTSNGVQLLADGDMELNNVVNWSPNAGTVLTKETVGAHGGSRWLKANTAGAFTLFFPAAPMMTIGRTYRISGWARGDGAASNPAVVDSAWSVVYWLGTASASWQYFTFTIIATTTNIGFVGGAASFVGLDDITVELCPASTRNLGTLSGTVQLGDGVTPATFPTQVFPHGMSFDGSSDYLLRAETAGELTFTDPAPFSAEMLVVRLPLAVGSYAFFFSKAGGGAGFVTPFVLYLRNDAGTMRLAWGSLSTGGALRGLVELALGNSWPAGVITHFVGVYDGTTWRAYFNSLQAFAGVTAGCYAPDVANFPLYIGAGRLGAGALSSWAAMQNFNWAIYPFALQPGEVAQLYQQRRSLLNRGA